MKVIIQDVESGEYLAADGMWVANITQAEDFLTLMRAYHHARKNTACNFQVMLYCPDDNYSAQIMEGIGTNEAAEVTVRVPIEIKCAANTAWAQPIVATQPRYSHFRISALEAARSYLN